MDYEKKAKTIPAISTSKQSQNKVLAWDRHTNVVGLNR
jgi:hypothetical protein